MSKDALLITEERVCELGVEGRDLVQAITLLRRLDERNSQRLIGVDGPYSVNQLRRMFRDTEETSHTFVFHNVGSACGGGCLEDSAAVFPSFPLESIFAYNQGALMSGS